MIALDRLRTESVAAPLVERAIAAPHPDIELGVARQPLRMLVAAPAAGIGRRTGLVLFLVGYGQDPFGAYVRSLLPWLAQGYDCVAASLDYFGAWLWGPKCRKVPAPDFFARLEEHHGIKVALRPGVSLDALMAELARRFARGGIMEMHRDCVVYGLSPEYHSMGFLPALDGLAATHRLIAEFAPDPRRLFLLGTSYGGYIASLMAKLAPQTFRMVIDNSGFSSAEDDIANVYGAATIVTPDGVVMRGKPVAAFSDDPASPAYFTPEMSAVRSLLKREHAYPNSARFYAYHAAGDTIAPTERKLLLRDVYAGRAAYDLALIDETALDGRVFKTPEHGMRASMRGLFALSHDKFQRDGGALAGDTDFDRGACWSFPCGRKEYVVRFSCAGGVTARIA